MTRVFLAGIFHETHSFSGDTTGLDGFVIHRGAEITARRGDASQVAPPFPTERGFLIL